MSHGMENETVDELLTTEEEEREHWHGQYLIITENGSFWLKEMTLKCVAGKYEIVI